MNYKKIVSGIIALSILTSGTGSVYAQGTGEQNDPIILESNGAPLLNTNPNNAPANDEEFFFVIPLAWGAAEIAAFLTTGATVVTGVTLANLQTNPVYKSTKDEIETAANAIPKKLKKADDEYSVDVDKFSKKVKGKTAYKEPKTGWEIDKSNTNHKGDAWKLNNASGKRVASLDKNGKIVGK